jgi:uncharacterized protein with HEPN domain
MRSSSWAKLPAGFPRRFGTVNPPFRGRTSSACGASYDQIDDDELWEVIEHDLPELLPKLESVLATL